MRSQVVLRFAISIAVAAMASAQNVTVPATLAGVEGGGASNIPFGSSQACRYQCIYDAEELPWTGPRVITGLLLRADNNTPFAAIAAKGFLDVSVLVSTTDKNSATASSVFADNYGTDATWVINHQLMQLPAQPLLTTAPRPANIPLVFTVPWAFGLTPATSTMPAPKNLLVEIWVHAQPSGLYRLDNFGSCASTLAVFGNAGPACAPAGGVNVTLTGDASLQAGSAYGWLIEHAPPAAPFLLALDLTNSGGLFGNPALPLPVPLFDPQNPTLPPPGLPFVQAAAPDCYLNITPVGLLGGVANAAGIGAVTGQLPPGRQYVGLTIYSQAIVFAPTANPLLFVASRGHSATVCGPLGVARLHVFYNASATPPTSGSLAYGVGLIFDVM
jgi:hypothetical protein